MNLYRGFGNLMEAWVTKVDHTSYSDLLENNGEGSPKLSTNLRTESVDSGVETASSDMSFQATSGSVSTENTELDTFTPEPEGDKDNQTSESSVLSCPSPSPPSPCLCPSSSRDVSNILHQKVEQALKRTNSKCIKNKSETLTADHMARRQPRASFLPKRHMSELVRGQRSEGFDLRRMFITPQWSRPVQRRPASVIYETSPCQRKLQDLSEEEARGLSPGLCYLENVCQLLEEFARQQAHKQEVQKEIYAPRECQEMELNQVFDACQSDSQAAAAADNGLSSLRLEKKSEENSPAEARPRKDYHRHFRQRSASDANLATLHLRMLDADCRGQHMSTDDLLKEDLKKQEPNEKTVSRNRKFKILSVKTDSSFLKGQQMQSTEKTQARLRLNQLFRRNKKKTMSV